MHRRGHDPALQGLMGERNVFMENRKKGMGVFTIPYDFKLFNVTNDSVISLFKSSIIAILIDISISLLTSSTVLFKMSFGSIPSLAIFLAIIVWYCVYLRKADGMFFSAAGKKSIKDKALKR